jgi:hypothetical protein
MIDCQDLNYLPNTLTMSTIALYHLFGHGPLFPSTSCHLFFWAGARRVFFGLIILPSRTLNKHVAFQDQTVKSKSNMNTIKITKVKSEPLSIIPANAILLMTPSDQ